MDLNPLSDTRFNSRYSLSHNGHRRRYRTPWWVFQRAKRPAPTHLTAAADFGALNFELQDVHDDQLDSRSSFCCEMFLADQDKQPQSGSKPTRTLRSPCWTMKRSRVLPGLRRRMPSSLGTPLASTRSSTSLGIWASPSASAYVFDNLLLCCCSELTCLVADRRRLGPEQQDYLRSDFCLPQDANQDVPGQRPEARRQHQGRHPRRSDQHLAASCWNLGCLGQDCRQVPRDHSQNRLLWQILLEEDLDSVPVVVLGQAMYAFSSRVSRSELDIAYTRR